MHKALSFCSNSITSILIVVIFLLTKNTVAQIAKGTDVGWLSYFENKLGITYINDSGQEQDALQILKDHDISAVRLRAFVNPTEENIGEVTTADVVKNAVRAKNLGLDVMITIHYSDTWADPGKQYKPQAWQNLSFEQLSQAVYDYTYQFIDALLQAGVTPKWVQVGNETDPGFIWEEGRLSSSNNFANMPNFVTLSNRGYDAIKDRSPTTKVITHIADGNNRDFLVGFFNAFYTNGGKNDVIGVSYYPRWHSGTIQNVGSNLELLANQFDKEVMICEIGALETSPEFNYNMLVDAINLVDNIPNNKGLGVFYWEPIAHTSINGYEQGLALPVDDKKYRFSWVLDAFKENAENCTPTTLTPLVKINDEEYKETTEIIGRVGNTIKFNSIPNTTSTWFWEGPNGFTADTREIELTDIQKNQAGIYRVTYIPALGCPASIEYNLEIYEVGEVIVENAGFEAGEISPWIGVGNYGVDTDLVTSGFYSGWFGGGNSELYQSITDLMPNTIYEFSCYIRNASGDNGTVTVGVRNFGNTTVTTNVPMTGNGGNDFELAKVAFTTGITHTSAEIFVATNKANTWGKVDDVKVFQVNALSTNVINLSVFEMFPNPTKDKLYIKTNNSFEDCNINMYNLLGKKLLSEKINFTKNNKVPLNTSNLGKGIYLVEIINQSVKNIQKLVIE